MDSKGMTTAETIGGFLQNKADTKAVPRVGTVHDGRAEDVGGNFAQAQKQTHEFYAGNEQPKT